MAVSAASLTPSIQSLQSMCTYKWKHLSRSHKTLTLIVITITNICSRDTFPGAQAGTDSRGMLLHINMLGKHNYRVISITFIKPSPAFQHRASGYMTDALLAFSTLISGTDRVWGDEEGHIPYYQRFMNLFKRLCYCLKLPDLNHAKRNSELGTAFIIIILA